MAVVADLRGGGSLAAAALQREAADLVGEADHRPGSHTDATLSGALQVQADTSQYTAPVQSLDTLFTEPINKEDTKYFSKISIKKMLKKFIV